MNEYDGFRIDIEIYKNFGKDYWAQAKYLVHGYDDVFWSNDIEAVLIIIKEELEKYEKLFLHNKSKESL